MSNYIQVCLFIAGLLLLDQVMSHQMFDSASDKEGTSSTNAIASIKVLEMLNVVDIIAVLLLLPLNRPFCCGRKTNSASEV